MNTSVNHSEKNSKSIAIVEDDDGLRFLIQKRLQQNGFQTISIADEKELFNNLQKIHCASLLLLDYKLPNTTASAILEKLQQQNIAIPFIIITGHGDEKKAVEMMKLGALDYLVKDEHFFDLLTPVILQTFKQIENKQTLVQNLQRNKEKDIFKLLHILQKHNDTFLNATFQYFQNKIKTSEISNNSVADNLKMFKSVYEHDIYMKNCTLSALIDYSIAFFKTLFPENKITFLHHKKNDGVPVPKANTIFQILLYFFDYCKNVNTNLEITLNSTSNDKLYTIDLTINNMVMPEFLIHSFDDFCCFSDTLNEEQCCNIFLYKTIITQGLNGKLTLNQTEKTTHFNISF